MTVGETEALATVALFLLARGRGGGTRGDLKNEERGKKGRITPCGHLQPSVGFLDPELTDSLSAQHSGAVRTPPPVSIRIFLEMGPPGILRVGA